MHDETPISELRLNSRARSVVRRLGLSTVGEVRRMPDFTLLRERGLGIETLWHIRQVVGSCRELSPVTREGTGESLESKLRTAAALLIEVADIIQAQGGMK